MANCMKCGRELKLNEIGLHRKIVHRGATEFMCLTCMAEYFKVEEKELEQLIANFKKVGCRLFV